MKLVHFATVLVLALFSAARGDQGGQQSLPINDVRKWKIVTSDKATSCQKYAAEEFQRFFQTDDNLF